MNRPVLVIHGVANPDYEGFDKSVREVEAGMPEDYAFIRGFWGDLGARPLGIEDAVPLRQTSWLANRDGSMDPPPPFEGEALIEPDPAAPLLSGAEVRDLGLALIAEDVRVDVSGESRPARDTAEIVAAAAIDRLKNEGVTGQDKAVREAIAAALASHPLAGRPTPDAALQELGIAIAERFIGTQLRSAAGTELWLSPADFFDALLDIAERTIGVVEDAVGGVVDIVGGKINREGREFALSSIGGGFGDLLIYQHQHPRIQARLWDCIEAEAPGWGTEEQPLAVMAHSLGGIIAWDMALSPDQPLWIDPLITFGSQSAVIQILSPRRRWEPGNYKPGIKLELPSTIRRWGNLFDPIDPLAFSSARVFRTSSPNRVRDVYLPYATSKGVFSHTSYWNDPVLHGVAARYLAGKEPPYTG